MCLARKEFLTIRGKDSVEPQSTQTEEDAGRWDEARRKMGQEAKTGLLEEHPDLEKASEAASADRVAFKNASGIRDAGNDVKR